jgi:hypothetical protein
MAPACTPPAQVVRPPGYNSDDDVQAAAAQEPGPRLQAAPQGRATAARPGSTGRKPGRPRSKRPPISDDDTDDDEEEEDEEEEEEEGEDDASPSPPPPSRRAAGGRRAPSGPPPEQPYAQAWQQEQQQQQQQSRQQDYEPAPFRPGSFPGGGGGYLRSSPGRPGGRAEARGPGDHTGSLQQQQEVGLCAFRSPARRRLREHRCWGRARGCLQGSKP